MIITFLRDRIILLGIIFFLAWVSFIPETLQGRFLHLVKHSLLFLLLISLWKHGFNLPKFFFNKEDIFIWLYFILVSVGLINAVDRVVAVRYYMDLVIMGGSIYFLVKHSVNEKNCKMILRVLVVFSFIIGLIGVLEMLSGKNIIYEGYVDNYFYTRLIRQRRMMSTLMNSNILGCYLLACAPLACYFYSEAKTRRKKAIYLVIAIVLAISILLTFSRGTWMAALLTLSVYMLLKNRKKAIVFVWCGFLMFMVIVSFLPDSFFKHRFSAPNLVRYVRFQHRTVQYLVTLNMLKERPFAGIGLKNYRQVFEKYSDKKLYDEVRIPDSIYLMHLAETGLVGFLGFFIFLVTILKRGFLFLKKSGHDKRFFLFIFLAFIAILFNMASFDGFLWHTPFYLFWIFAGIISSLSIRRQNETSR